MPTDVLGNAAREMKAELDKGQRDFPADPVAPIKARSRAMAKYQEPVSAFDYGPDQKIEYPPIEEGPRSESGTLTKTAQRRRNNPDNAFVKKS